MAWVRLPGVAGVLAGVVGRAAGELGSALCLGLEKIVVITTDRDLKVLE